MNSLVFVGLLCGALASHNDCQSPLLNLLFPTRVCDSGCGTSARGIPGPCNSCYGADQDCTECGYETHLPQRQSCGRVSACNSCDSCDSCDTPCRTHRGPLSLVASVFSRDVWSCSGCGERYYGDWYSDPPDCHDPCDRCGNFTGRSSRWNGWGSMGTGVSGYNVRGAGYYSEGGSGCKSCGQRQTGPMAPVASSDDSEYMDHVFAPSGPTTKTSPTPAKKPKPTTIQSR